jgi:hypothetical protein
MLMDLCGSGKGGEDIEDTGREQPFSWLFRFPVSLIHRITALSPMPPM